MKPMMEAGQEEYTYSLVNLKSYNKKSPAQCWNTDRGERADHYGSALPFYFNRIGGIVNGELHPKDRPLQWEEVRSHREKPSWRP